MFIRSPLSRVCLVAALAASLILAVPVSSRGAGEAAALERTKQQIAEIKKRLAAAKGRAAEIEAQVRALDSQIASLNAQIRSGEHDISELESGIRSANAKIAELQVKYDKALNASKQRARALYKSGPVDTVSRMLSAKSILEFARLRVIWEISSEIDGKVMLDAVRLRADLDEKKLDLEHTKNDLAARRGWLRERKNLIASARAEKNAALGSIKDQIHDDEAHVKGLEEESRRLTAVLKGSLSRSTGSVSRTGFVWPLRGQITSAYGYRRGGFHPGIDIDGNTGDPIVASKAGSLSGVSCGSGYGICTIIDHGDGVATLYAHMTRKAVYGGHVERGQVIGYVGCTGSCTGSHLHFEVRVNGSPQNPRNFLP